MLKPSTLFFVNKIISFFPPTRFYPLKAKLFKLAGVEIGENVRIVSSVKIWGSGELVIGDNTFIGHETSIISAGETIRIGNNVDISSRVLIVNGTHKKHDIQNKAAGTGYSLDINICDGVWIGAGVTIIGGSNIPLCSIVGACSLVNSDNYRERCVLVGVPARELKNNE